MDDYEVRGARDVTGSTPQVKGEMIGNARAWRASCNSTQYIAHILRYVDLSFPPSRV